MATTTTDDTRQRLLNVAGRCFAEKGFETTTVRDICSEAGANTAAVNYYFGSKERLYLEAIKQAHACRAHDIPLPKWPPGASPEVKLRSFIETLLRRMLQDENSPWHAQLMMRELFHPTVACAELVRDYIRPQFETLLGILDQMLPQGTPDRQRHLLAFSTVGQCLFHRVARPVVTLLVPEREYRTYEPARLAEHITTVMLAAVHAAADAVRKGGPT